MHMWIVAINFEGRPVLSLSYIFCYDLLKLVHVSFAFAHTLKRDT